MGALVGGFVGAAMIGVEEGAPVGELVRAFVPEMLNSPVVPPVAVSTMFRKRSRILVSAIKALIAASLSTTIGIPVDEKLLKVASNTAVVSLRICCRKKRRYL